MSSTAEHTPQRGGPLVLDTRTLGRRPGSMREERRTVALEAQIGNDMIALAAGAPVELDLMAEAVIEGVLITGTVTGHAEGTCVRCLKPVGETLELHLTELFAYPGSVTDETTEDDEIPLVEDELIDLEQTLIDLVVLELPLQPLCDEDCPGLCPQCGIDLAIAPEGHSHEMIDPRWAALAEMAGAGGDSVRAEEPAADHPETDSPTEER